MLPPSGRANCAEGQDLAFSLHTSSYTLSSVCVSPATLGHCQWIGRLCEDIQNRTGRPKEALWSLELYHIFTRFFLLSRHGLYLCQILRSWQKHRGAFPRLPLAPCTVDTQNSICPDFLGFLWPLLDCFSSAKHPLTAYPIVAGPDIISTKPRVWLLLRILVFI